MVEMYIELQQILHSSWSHSSQGYIANCANVSHYTRSA